MKIDKKYLIYIAYITFIVVGASSGLLNIAWTYMKETFNVSLDSLGTLLTAGTVGGVGAALLSGTLIGRFSIGRFLLTGAIIATIGLVGYAVAPSWILLLLIVIFATFGKGSLDAGFNNFVSANYGPSEMNWLHACWGLGLTIAPGIVTFIVVTQGQVWQVSYLVMASLMGILALVIGLLLPNWKLVDKEAMPGEKTKPAASLNETIRRPIVLMSLLLFFIYGGVEIGTGQLANTLLVESRNISQETSSTWISTYWGTFTLGRMLIGLLALRIGDKLLINISMGLSLLGAILLVSNLHEITSFLGLLLLGFGLAAIFPLLMSQTPGRVGLRYSPQTIGFQVGFASFGGAAVPGLTAVLAQHMGLEIIGVVILACAILQIVMYRLILWREEYNQQMASA